MKATSMKQAWEMVDLVFPTDYIKDEVSSSRAGYDIYKSTVSESTNYICDLGNRLEVNLANGKTVNIWVEEEKAVRTVYYVTYKYSGNSKEFTFWTEDEDVVIELMNTVKSNPNCKLVSVTTAEC